MNSKNIVIGSIPKKDGTQIRASISEYKKEFYIDIREFVENEEYQGPTKKGIRFHSENWDSFFELIRKIDQEVKRVV